MPRFLYGASSAMLLAAAATGAAEAQQPVPPYRQVCTVTALPFLPAPATQMRAAEVQKVVAGKRVIMLRSIDVVVDGSAEAQRGLQRYGRPTHRRFSYDIRDDGSVRLHCDVLGGTAGSAQPCPNISTQQGARGPGEVGTWRITSDALCFAFSRYGDGREICGSLHRHGGKLWFHHLRGSARGCFEGEIEMHEAR